MLLFALSGWFALRCADRAFLAGLFQLPPRNTRLSPFDESPRALYIAYTLGAGYLINCCCRQPSAFA